MPDLSPVSRAELAERRRRLRHQRRWRTVQASWRTIAVSGITVGLLWVTTLPTWVVYTPSQVKIEGNQLLSSDAIQALLPIKYPQSLLAIQPHAIAQYLESKGPIAEATVIRRLLPPGLVIQIRERRPVAIAYTHSISAESAPVLNGNNAPSGVGLLDAKGHWTPLESYTTLDQAIELPTLKVIGTPDQYRSQWAQLYSEVSQSPVKISQIDWQDLANLILTTELGIVHFGAYSTRFAKQLQALDQMRQLPQKIDPEEIIYIDLTNPEVPVIQMNDATQTKPLEPQ